MAFQSPITIKKALDQIKRHEYVLPAIQREYVWKPAQICRLFDSLMRGYPIGSFLFWHVAAENVEEYRFYDFVLHYHERDAPHCPALVLPGDKSVTATLDGQQRLTALNIGLRGSHAEKIPYKWWSSPDAFPKKQLYLKLTGEAEENEEGMIYDFRFLTEESANEFPDEDGWFRVADILAMEEVPELHSWVVDRGLGSEKGPFRVLTRLQQVVTTDLVIVHFLEEEQDLDKVLDIFIRTNSGGTVLSYSDLLLSIATAQWTELDARKEIHDLVDELNDVRNGFSFNKDFVLKAGLMLADIGSVGFRVTNFNKRNMERLQEVWPQITKALRITVALAADFGFSERTLSAQNALLPIAYYLFDREHGSDFVASTRHAEDREKIRFWLVRSLLKKGIWGSGLDTLLSAIREEIRNSSGSFPAFELQRVMSKRGKSLRFAKEEIEDLVDIDYNNRRTFPTLALLFPFVDLRNEFHVDHIFPRSLFGKRNLETAGIEGTRLDEFKEAVNRLANLQLLPGTENSSKMSQQPAEWLERAYPDPRARAEFRDRHLLGEVPSAIAQFLNFYRARRQRLVERLEQLVGGEEAIELTQD